MLSCRITWRTFSRDILNISGYPTVPPVFWGFLGMLTEETRDSMNTWLMAGGLAGIALTSQYYLYLTALISGLILLKYFLF